MNLWRRVHSSFIIFDHKTGQYRPSAAALSSHKHMVRCTIVEGWSRFLSDERRFPVCAINVRELTDLGFTVHRLIARSLRSLNYQAACTLLQAARRHWVDISPTSRRTISVLDRQLQKRLPATQEDQLSDPLPRPLDRLRSKTIASNSRPQDKQKARTKRAELKVEND